MKSLDPAIVQCLFLYAALAVALLPFIIGVRPPWVPLGWAGVWFYALAVSVLVAGAWGFEALVGAADPQLAWIWRLAGGFLLVVLTEVPTLTTRVVLGALAVAGVSVCLGLGVWTASPETGMVVGVALVVLVLATTRYLARHRKA